MQPKEAKPQEFAPDVSVSRIHDGDSVIVGGVQMKFMRCVAVNMKDVLHTYSLARFHRTLRVPGVHESLVYDSCSPTQEFELHR